ncbi:acylphosphatase [Arthrobacter rhombi]|uniref:acylphosphatase n=1 Tax=Arthrobacter rhombi TaxID=71253 RepID=UPI0031E02CEA
MNGAPTRHPGHDDGAPAAIEATATGTVQGVGFRYLTRQKAEALGLAGAAVNCRDGSVRITAQGAQEDLDALVDWLRSAQAPGRVGHLGVRQVMPDPGATGFAVG